MPKLTDPEEERRRRPRFSCGGQVRLNRLPSDGIILAGSIRDLSLHGCCVEIDLPMDPGVRAEIVVYVNAASFRAVGEVKRLHHGFGAGLEFVHLSAGGRDMLAETIARLAKMQAVVHKMKSGRREMSAEALLREMQEETVFGMAGTAMLKGRLSFPAAIVAAESAEDGRDVKQTSHASFTGNGRIEDVQPIVIEVDVIV
jgi:hypothetical protein